MGIVFELQACILILTAGAIAMTWDIGGWIGWALVTMQAIGGVAAAIAVRVMLTRT